MLKSMLCLDWCIRVGKNCQAGLFIAKITPQPENLVAPIFDCDVTQKIGKSLHGFHTQLLLQASLTEDQIKCRLILHVFVLCSMAGLLKKKPPAVLTST